MRLRTLAFSTGVGLGASAIVLIGLFIANGLWLAPGESAVLGHTGFAARPLRQTDSGVEVRVLAYNIAKGFAYRQRLRFDDPDAIRERLDALAVVIREVDADLVFLSEALNECPPCGVSQIRYLAERTAAHAWLFGECYNIGLPFYRVSGGNGILSRIPIDRDVNLSLVGRKPFYASANNRRALFGTVQIGTRTVLLGSLHNDSRAGPNNIAQMQQVLEYTAGRPAILGGDFNARPAHPSLELVRAANRFTAVIATEPTHPARRPNRTIDYIVAPSSWDVLEYRVLDTQASDHRPVFARFRCPREECGL